MVRDETQDAAEPPGTPMSVKLGVSLLVGWLHHEGKDCVLFGPGPGGPVVIAADGATAVALSGLTEGLQALEDAGFDSTHFLQHFASGLKAVAAGGPVPELAVKRKAP